MDASSRAAEAAALYALYFHTPPAAERSATPDDGATRLAMLDKLRAFVRSPSSPFREVCPTDAIRAKGSIHVEWSAVSHNDGPLTEDPSSDWRRFTRQELLHGLAYSVHEALLRACPPPPDPQHTAWRLRQRRVHIRIHGMKTVLPMRDIRADTIGKLVCLSGSVIRVSSLRPMVQAINFHCPRCGASVNQPLPDAKFVPPTACPNHGCRAKTLVPNRASASVRDYQKIRLQEVPTDANRKEFYGHVPRTVEVELLDDLVDCCVPGDTLHVCGLVKSIEVPAEGGGRGGGSNKPKCMYLLYVEALSVTNAKGSGQAKSGSEAASKEANDEGDALSLSPLDLHAVADIAREPRLFELLVASLCPSSFGHEVVKAGLMLALFGGGARKAGGDQLAKRADIHVLVVGDPGMGKSQMLTATAALAPRGVYVCGNTTSSSGLTVTVVKDAISGDFALEAGALVMGDQGCCCIDEFDKMGGGEYQALLEAMEQQSISVAKAGIVCSLSARTAVLAAANPVGGHYNRARTVSENLKLPANLLSRFDLIFVLLDRPNEAMDKLLSAHVMALHGGVASRGAERMAEAFPAGAELGGDGGTAGGLALRLRVNASAHEPIPTPLLRKYIAYARQYCHPVLSEEAHGVLHDFFLSLRGKQRGGDTVPITSRQLESLIRLAEARARMELREVVSSRDAMDAVEVVQETIFFDTFADIVGGLGGGALAAGSVCARANPRGGVSAGRVVASFVSVLEHEAEAKGDAMFTTAELKESFSRSGLPLARACFADFVEELNAKNYILKKGQGLWKLQISGLSMSARA
ncbi:hypothetical protein AB1Y20_015038 [Prymnesium parvum]|uniref:Minichromosome maintenance 8 n=1 Tax=Prymnesium parvum TaxID=97485 RepID=A0AB34JXA5_PRYPA